MKKLSSGRLCTYLSRTILQFDRKKLKWTQYDSDAKSLISFHKLQILDSKCPSNFPLQKKVSLEIATNPDPALTFLFYLEITLLFAVQDLMCGVEMIAFASEPYQVHFRKKFRMCKLLHCNLAQNWCAWTIVNWQKKCWWNLLWFEWGKIWSWVSTYYKRIWKCHEFT